MEESVCVGVGCSGMRGGGGEGVGCSVCVWLGGGRWGVNFWIVG